MSDLTPDQGIAPFEGCAFVGDPPEPFTSWSEWAGSGVFKGVTILATKPAKYGCHCDLEPGMEPDDCVLDYGRPFDCIHAGRLLSEGKPKQQCEYWRPIARVIP